jgi:hypothetical protein
MRLGGTRNAPTVVATPVGRVCTEVCWCHQWWWVKDYISGVLATSKKLCTEIEAIMTVLEVEGMARSFWSGSGTSNRTTSKDRVLGFVHQLARFIVNGRHNHNHDLCCCFQSLSFWLTLPLLCESWHSRCPIHLTIISFGVHDPSAQDHQLLGHASAWAQECLLE